jgi:formyl-CoA transferase
MSLYPCKGGGANDYVYIMAITPRMWGSLCEAIGKSELIDDPRFRANRDRLDNREELEALISEWTLQRDKYDAMQELADGGVPASAVLDTRDLYENPHLTERGFVHSVDHPTHGPIRLLGFAARMSESEVPFSAAPLLGQHSKEVIAEDLGLSPAEIDALVTAGVIDQC